VRLGGAPVCDANALTVRDSIKEMIVARDSPVRAMIFDASAQNEIDATSAKVLTGLFRELRDRDIVVYVADVRAPGQEHGRKTGFLVTIGEGHLFATVVHVAVTAVSNEQRKMDP
jgi:MFS superfamily sulfate permease-like transporter